MSSPVLNDEDVNISDKTNVSCNFDVLKNIEKRSELH